MKSISNIHKEDFTLTNDLMFDSKIYISNYTFNRKKWNHFPNLKYAIENKEKS